MDTDYGKTFREYFENSKSYSVKDLVFDDLTRNYYFVHQMPSEPENAFRLMLNPILYPYGLPDYKFFNEKTGEYIVKKDSIYKNILKEKPDGWSSPYLCIPGIYFSRISDFEAEVVNSYEENIKINDFTDSKENQNLPYIGFITPIEKVFEKYHFNFNKGWRYGYQSDHSIDIDEFFQSKSEYFFGSEIVVRANSFDLEGSLLIVRVKHQCLEFNDKMTVKDFLFNLRSYYKHYVMMALDKGFKVIFYTNYDKYDYD